MESDYFTPLNDLKTAAFVFCNHKSIRDWFWYLTGLTIADVMSDTEDILSELEAVRHHLRRDSDSLIEALQEYELFEECLKVQAQTKKLYRECFAMQMQQEQLQKGDK